MKSILKFIKFFMLLGSLFALIPTVSFAEASYKIEIDHLLDYVKTTQCTYIRNGTPHNGIEAANHIKNKFDYYKNDVASAEDFIRLSATKSTIFGSKYYIKCTGSPKMESGVWLLQELDRYRKKESK